MSTLRRFTLLVAALAATAALAPAMAQAAWTPASWTLPSTDSQFAGSSCVSTTFCVFVGYQTGSPRGLAYKYNGSTYSSTSLASSTAELYGVGCATTTFCMAVGTNYAATPNTPYATTYNGTTWSTSTPVTPGSATFTQLNGVSCTSSTFCAAAGRFQTSTASNGLVETYNGTSWSQASLTPPAGTTGAELNDISCTASNACTAVGYRDSASPRVPLIYRYNGTSWASQTPAVPSGAQQAELEGVTCQTSTSCQAVGAYVDSLGVQHALAESWNGTSWSLKTVADPSGAQDSGLADIACYTTSTTGCVAVGSYTASGGNSEPEAAGWNGTAWSLQSVSRPTGTSDALLRGVGCASSTFCRAVGASLYDGSAGITGLRPAIDVGP